MVVLQLRVLGFQQRQLTHVSAVASLKRLSKDPFWGSFLTITLQARIQGGLWGLDLPTALQLAALSISVLISDRAVDSASYRFQRRHE